MGNKKPKAASFVRTGKVPQAAAFPTPNKTVVSADPGSYASSSPSWRVAGLKLVDPFGWHKIDGPTALKIQERLKNFETMNWNQILVVANKQNHRIETSKICKEARADLEARKILLEQVVSLRLTGEQRIWGYLVGSVLVLLWFDPEHKIYPYKKPNT